MSNEHLRAALQQAGLRPDDLADVLGVDVKTVRRWLAGMTPYPRHRGKVARALDTTEAALWPHTAPAPPTSQSIQSSDLVAAYPTTNDPSAPDWRELLDDASERIELLDDTLQRVLQDDDIPDRLAEKAGQGCVIRILIAQWGSAYLNVREGLERAYDPARNLELDSTVDEYYDELEDRIEDRFVELEDIHQRSFQHVQALLQHPGIEARDYVAPRFNSILRFDDHMLVTHHLWAQPTQEAPLTHLTRRSPGGLFDRYAQHFEDLWRDAAYPIEPGPAHASAQAVAPSLERYEPKHEQDRTASRDPAGLTDDEAPPPPPRRRWPGRDK